MKSFLTFTVIATTTIFKILIIVALVVIIFPTPGTLQSPWRFLMLTKLSSLKGVSLGEIYVRCEKGLKRSSSLLLHVNLISTVHVSLLIKPQTKARELWTHPRCYAFLTSSLLITIVFSHLLGQGIGSFGHSSKWLWNTYNNLFKRETTAVCLKGTISLHLWCFMQFFSLSPNKLKDKTLRCK